MKKILLFLCAALLVICLAANVQALSFDPPSLDFGNVEVGESKVLTGVLSHESNNGQWYQINSVVVTGSGPDEFSTDLSPSFDSIYYGNDREFSVTFIPGSIGDFMALVSVSGMQGDSMTPLAHPWGPLELSVKGTGVTSGTSVPDASVFVLLTCSLIGLFGFGRKKFNT